jgi:hypothetical protein
LSVSRLNGCFIGISMDSDCLCSLGYRERRVNGASWIK